MSSRSWAVPRDELRAAVEARRELWPEYDEHVLDSFARELERRFDERYGRTRRRSEHKDKELALAIVSLGVCIPLLAIAGGTAGLAGVVAVAAAVVLVNLLFRL